MSTKETAVKETTGKRGRKERAGVEVPKDWTRKNVDVTYVKNSAPKDQPDNSKFYSVGVPQAPSIESLRAFLTGQNLDPDAVLLAAYNARNLTFSQAGNAEVKKAFAQLSAGEIDQAAFDKIVQKAQRRVARSVFTGKVRSGISQAKKAAFADQVAAAISKGATMADIAKLAAELGLAPAAQ